MESKQRTVEEMRDRERDLLRQIEKVTQECELKHSENERNIQKLKTQQSYSTTLERDLKDLRDQVSSLTS